MSYLKKIGALFVSSATSGSYENIKVTTPEDIAVAEAFLYRREKK